MIRAVVAAGLLLLGCASNKPKPDESKPEAVEPPPRELSHLERLYAEELKRDAPLSVEPGSPLEQLDHRTFLFVSGFLNEAIPGYFKDQTEVVKELGAKAHTFEPSSFTAMSDEADKVQQRVLSAYGKDERPVVLVGHSMGGASSLLCLIRYPELVTEGKLDKVIVIQGAVGGSPLADTLAHGPLTRIQGLKSLTREEAQAQFKKELELLRAKVGDEGLKQLFGRVYYVRSFQEKHVAAELAMSRLFLSSFGSGDNDGLVLKEDMMLPDGVDLGVLEADHAGLTVSSFLSRTTPQQRKAFTRALLREVYEVRR